MHRETWNQNRDKGVQNNSLLPGVYSALQHWPENHWLPVQQDRKHPRVLKLWDMPQDQIIVLTMEMLLISFVKILKCKIQVIICSVLYGSYHVTERVVRHWSDCPGMWWRCSRKDWTWHLVLRSGWCGGDQLQVRLNLRDLLQHKWFCDHVGAVRRCKLYNLSCVIFAYLYMLVLKCGGFHHRWQQPPKLDSISTGKKTEAKILWIVLSGLKLED